MPASDALKLGGMLAALKTAPALPTLGRFGKLLPWRSAADEGGGRRRPWILFGGMAGLLVLSSAGLAAIAILRPAAAARPAAAPVAASPQASADPLRRIRILGDQLNLVSRTVDGRLFIYAGGAIEVQRALSLVKSGGRNGARPLVVSLPALSSLAAESFRDFGFEVTQDAIVADGPSIALTVKVPATLQALHDAVAARLRMKLAAVPGLAPVHLEETVKTEDGPFLLATMVGKPASLAFTAEGTKEIGDNVLGQFKLRAVKAEEVEIGHGTEGKAGGVRMLVSLRGQSRIVEGSLDSVKPANLATSILD